MEKQLLELFVLAVRTRRDKVANVTYYQNENEALEALNSIDVSARAQVDIKFGKAVFNIITDDIDFWRDAKNDSWFRAELDSVKWNKI